MTGPADVWFTIAMPGWSFQVPVNSEGRLMEVCQLTAVLNVWSKSTRRSPPGAVVSGMSNSRRALLMLSVTSKVLLQFQGPMRRGVCKPRVETRLSANSVSKAPPGTSTGGWTWWNDCGLENENPGDHAMDGVMLMGDGARLTDGMVGETRPLPTSCRRLPPMLRVPQSNCFVKLICEVRLAVARNGLTVLVSMTWVLLE